MRRFITISPNRNRISDFENLRGAEAAALAFGDGAHVVDTESNPYQPAVQAVEYGLLTYVGYGSFDKGLGVNRNFLESVKRGEPAAAIAFLARGADPDTADESGGTALIWAVARGDAALVEILLHAGADLGKANQKGLTAGKLAVAKGLTAITGMLLAADT